VTRGHHLQRGSFIADMSLRKRSSNGSGPQIPFQKVCRKGRLSRRDEAAAKLG
jgi:hypothetical protein